MDKLNINIKKIRSDFPVLREKVHGLPLVYLDNAATTLRPQVVVDALAGYYLRYSANIHRGVHALSEKATAEYEKSRRTVKDFIHASSTAEIIFTRGTTESINLVAQSFCRPSFKPDDEIVVTAMEHHSNIVPWQILCEQVGCRLKVIPMNDKGELILERVDSFLTERTQLLSIVYLSNSLGTINPVQDVIDKAHQKNIPVFVDAAQAMSHCPIDVQTLDCDFLAFSGHKIFGPSGIGVLYGKEKWLEQMPPYQGGGDMISSVTFEKTIYNTLPYKFEAGTPHIAGVIGLGAALEYVQSVGLDLIMNYEKDLLDYGTKALLSVPDLKLIGTASNKASVLSFILPPIHPHDIGTLIDEEGVAIRTGHHCTQPVMKFFKIPATSRASVAVYNTKEEIDLLVQALFKAKKIFD
ncbi:MAG: cysteine desulfurase [Candidatus Omnitrophica bacterium]|nr:cysteine desulfurase [Candidatus Omnitrophota bacterium]